MTAQPAPPPTRVVIAGGGTAGWLAAAALTRQLGALVSVTLVESDEFGTIGVGESTIPTTRTFHDVIGLDERDFVRSAGATFKLGILFDGWRTSGNRYFHPFGKIGRSLFAADFQHFWLEGRRIGVEADYADFSLEAQAAAAGRFALGEAAGLSYAYHLDATAYAARLRQLAEASGTQRCEGKILAVELAPENGNIAALRLDRDRRIEGDFFLDCTGFRALLLGDALGVPFEDWSNWLPTDSAIAVQTSSAEQPAPFTRATAHEAGWRWRIPLQRRDGNGIVFASGHMQSDEAEAKLRAALPGEPLTDPRLIRFRTGMRQQSWARNCIALGLAGGFIEPLESTSIHLVMVALSRLLKAFPFTPDAVVLATRYNKQSRREWEHVRDFIVLHYHLNERTEPFWVERREAPIPASLAERLALFREGGLAYQDGDDLFRVESWVAVLTGQGVMPEHHHGLPRLLPPEQLRGALNDLRTGVRQRAQQIPDQATFLKQLLQGA